MLFIHGHPRLECAGRAQRRRRFGLQSLRDPRRIRESDPDPKRRRRYALPAHSRLPLALLYFALRKFHQFFRHPLTDAFRGCFFDAFGTIVPLITRAFGDARSLIVLSLFQRKYDALRDAVPIFLLNASQDQRQTGGPIFFRSAAILLRDGQVVSWRKRRTGILADELPRKLFVGSLPVFTSYRLRTPKDVSNGWAFVCL